MRRTLFKVAIVAALLGACSKTLSPSGELLYRRYCASCHGVAGKGDGPVAASLTTRPTDLTILAKHAGGRFNEPEVIAIIDGQRAVAAHGPREMPVWGIVFDEELRDEPYTMYMVLLRARVLSDYLRTIQEK